MGRSRESDLAIGLEWNSLQVMLLPKGRLICILLMLLTSGTIHVESGGLSVLSGVQEFVDQVIQFENNITSRLPLGCDQLVAHTQFGLILLCG